MVLYGQLVVGAPGSGKTTYCNGMQQYLRLIGRDCWVVNLDPANEVPLPSARDRVNDGASGENGQEEDEHDEEDEEGEANNPQLPYDTILDVCDDIISLDAVMSELHLGPNGGLMYCMEYIELHLGELIQILKERLGMVPDPSAENATARHSKAYLLFDLPGQIELTAHSSVVTRIAQRLVRALDLRLTCVQLVDAAVCLTDVSKFLGSALVCTASMIRLELPSVNVLSKMDLLKDCVSMASSTENGAPNSGRDGNDSDSSDDYGYDDPYSSSPLPFNLEFFTQCHDLHRLIDYLDSNPMDFLADTNSPDSIADELDPQFDYTQDAEYLAAKQKLHTSVFQRKYRKLHQELCDVVEDFGLLSFLPLSILDAESVGRVVARIDKSNGFIFVQEFGREGDDENGSGHGNQSSTKHAADLFSSAMASDAEWATGVMADVQEKYLGDVMFREEISELRRDSPKDRQRTKK